MNNKELYIDLSQRIFFLKAMNYAELMKTKIIPYIKDTAEAEGKEINDIDLYDYAHQIFCNLKKADKLDELNRIKQEIKE